MSETNENEKMLLFTSDKKAFLELVKSDQIKHVIVYGGGGDMGMAFDILDLCDQRSITISVKRAFSSGVVYCLYKKADLSGLRVAEAHGGYPFDDGDTRRHALSSIAVLKAYAFLLDHYKHLLDPLKVKMFVDHLDEHYFSKLPEFWTDVHPLNFWTDLTHIFSVSAEHIDEILPSNDFTTVSESDAKLESLEIQKN